MTKEEVDELYKKGQKLIWEATENLPYKNPQGDIGAPSGLTIYQILEKMASEVYGNNYTVDEIKAILVAISRTSYFLAQQNLKK